MAVPVGITSVAPSIWPGWLESVMVLMRRTVPTGLNAATLIGDYVTVEPYCVLRSCRVEPRVLIGARSVVCEGAIIEGDSVLTPGSVVPPARRIPSGQLWGGSPARFIRKLTGNEVSAGHERSLSRAGEGEHE